DGANLLGVSREAALFGENPFAVVELDLKRAGLRRDGDVAELIHALRQIGEEGTRLELGRQLTRPLIDREQREHGEERGYSAENRAVAGAAIEKGGARCGDHVTSLSPGRACGREEAPIPWQPRQRRLAPPRCSGRQGSSRDSPRHGAGWLALAARTSVCPRD